MLRRELRCRFLLLKPTPVSDKVNFELDKLKINNKNHYKTFAFEEKVVMKDFRKIKNNSLGKIYEIIVPRVSWIVEVYYLAPLI